MATGSWMSLLWFGVVLALIPGALWLLKRSGLAAGAARGAHAGPRLTGSLALGPQQRVVTVEVGEGAERRWLVLGVTPQQITALHTLTSPPAAAQPPSAGPVGPAVASIGRAGFAQVLSSAMGRPARPNPPPGAEVRAEPSRSTLAPQPPAPGQPSGLPAVRRSRADLSGANHGA
jgi:flagellar protein FliO/FliZ